MIIAVASGKGGTGKTTVAAGLAISMSAERKIQFLDCDVEEPDAHLFLRPSLLEKEPVFVPEPVVDQSLCDYCGRCMEVCAYNAIAVFERNVLVFPQLCHGCGGCSYFCPCRAIAEKGRIIGVLEAGRSGNMDFVHAVLNIGEAQPVPLVKAVKKRLNPECLVIVDASPGTSCPVVEAVRGSGFCLLVTEPTPFGLHDLAMAVEMTEALKIPRGVVINRSDLKYDDIIENFCLSRGIPLLLKIPFSREVAGFYARGVNMAEGIPEWRETFRELYQKVMVFSETVARYKR
jgi:MinD superfamily P-loop ATPase